MGPKIVQGIPRWFKMLSNMPPRGLKTTPRLPAVPSDLLEEASKKPKSFRYLRKINDLCLLPVSAPIVSEGVKTALKLPKKAPEGAQQGRNTAPRAPKIAPRATQEGPNR